MATETKDHLIETINSEQPAEAGNKETTTGESNLVVEHGIEGESLQRENSLQAAINYFNQEEVIAKRQQISEEPDPKQRAKMIKQFCTETNGILTGQQKPDFGVNVKVQQMDIDHETATEWRPPRPMNDIFDEYFEEAGNLFNAGNNNEAGSVLYLANTLGHAYRNGNGRNGRLLLLYSLNPEYTRQPEVIEHYIMSEQVQEKSRQTCNDILNDAIETIKSKLNITNLPFIFFGEISRSGGISNELLRIAYKQLHPMNTPAVIHLDLLPQDEQLQIRNRTNELGRDIMREVLHSTKARERVIQDMFTSQIE